MPYNRQQPEQLLIEDRKRMCPSGEFFVDQPLKEPLSGSSSTEKRSVRFSLDAEYHSVPSVETEEKNVVWYAAADYDRINEEAVTSEDRRGLENRDGSHRKNWLTAVNAVLDEQERQRYDGLNDVLIMSTVYIQASRHCRSLARKKAECDLEEAKQVYDEPPPPPANSPSPRTLRARKGLRRTMNWLKRQNSKDT